VEWRVLPKTRSSVVLSLAVVLISRDSSLLYKMLVPNRQRAIITLPKVIRMGNGRIVVIRAILYLGQKKRSAKRLPFQLTLCPHTPN
jgi:hypothetical protein